jgi:hypothetical protein
MDQKHGFNIARKSLNNNFHVLNRLYEMEKMTNRHVVFVGGVNNVYVRVGRVHLITGR